MDLLPLRALMRQIASASDRPAPEDSAQWQEKAAWHLLAENASPHNDSGERLRVYTLQTVMVALGAHNIALAKQAAREYLSSKA
jgi:hypothetical protein